MKYLFGALVLSCALTCVGCRRASDPTVVARVGSREIRITDVQKEAARQARRSGVAPDRERVLENLIEREQLLARARALGLDRDPTIQRAMDNLLIGHLRERELEGRLRNDASPSEDSSETKPVGESPASPRRERHIAVLQVTLPEKASPEIRRRLQMRIRQAREKAVAASASGPDFGELAVEFSDEPGSRFRGGDIGWVSYPAPRSRWSPDLLAAAFALAEPGAISQVIESGRHLYVVKLMGERTVPTYTAPGAVKTRHREEQRRRQELETRFMEAVRSSAPVVRFPQILQSVEITSATGRPDSDPNPPRLP